MGQILLDPAGSTDKVIGVVVVFFYPGGDREDVRVKDNVFGGKPTISVSN